MAEVQKMQEQFSVRPSMDINPPVRAVSPVYFRSGLLSANESCTVLPASRMVKAVTAISRISESFRGVVAVVSLTSTDQPDIVAPRLERLSHVVLLFFAAHLQYKLH